MIWTYLGWEFCNGSRLVLPHKEKCIGTTEIKVPHQGPEMINPVRKYQNSPLAPSNGRVPFLQENPERFFLKMCLELAMAGIALLGVSQNHLNRSPKWRKNLHHWKIKNLKMRICSFCQRTNLFGPLVVLRLWDWLSPRYGKTYPMLSMHSVAPWNLLHRKFVACYKH